MEQVLRGAINRGPAGDSWAGRVLGWLRRIARPVGAADAPLHIVARLSLGPKKSLVLVSCCGRRLLLSLSGDTIAPLMEIPKTTRRKGGVQ